MFCGYLQVSLVTILIPIVPRGIPLTSVNCNDAGISKCRRHPATHPWNTCFGVSKRKDIFIPNRTLNLLCLLAHEYVVGRASFAPTKRKESIRVSCCQTTPLTRLVSGYCTWAMDYPQLIYGIRYCSVWSSKRQVSKGFGKHLDNQVGALQPVVDCCNTWYIGAASAIDVLWPQIELQN